MDSGLEWPKIRALIQTPDIADIASHTIKPEGLRHMYDRARYLKQTRVTKPGKKDPDVFKSLTLWKHELVKKNWRTFTNIIDSDQFIFAFQSKWQLDMCRDHGRAMIMLDATHNSVTNLFLSDGKKISLYTFMIRDPVVGKGLPIAWAFTASAAEEPLSSVLAWLRQSMVFKPLAVMSDCALAITNAVKSTYFDHPGQTPHHYWCLFHVLKAFKAQTKTYLRHRADEAFDEFRWIVYLTSNPGPRFVKFWLRWRAVSRGFATYVRKQWASRIQHWAIFFRVTAHQGVHTNNYTEAWHKVLKTHYIPPPERKRIDELVSILTSNVEPDFRWAHIKAGEGFVGQTTNKFQQRAKTLGESYCRDSLQTLGIRVAQKFDHFVIDSFKNPTWISYTVKIDKSSAAHKGRLASCTCGHFTRCGSACKHMYYLAREHGMLVVEAVQPITGTQDLPIQLDDIDSDVEVLQTGVAVQHNNLTLQSHRFNHPSTQYQHTDTTGKRSLEVPAISNNSPASKRQRCRRSALTSPIPPVQPLTRPLLSDDIFTGPTVSRSETAGGPNLNYEQVEDKDRICLNRRAEVSSRAALKQIIDLMKTKQNRAEFALSASPNRMQEFVNTVHIILNTIEASCPGIDLTPKCNMDAVANAVMMNRREVDGLIEDLQRLGWDFLKKVVKLLEEPNNRMRLVGGLTCQEMSEHRERCFDVLGILEEHVAAAGRKKQQRWG